MSKSEDIDEAGAEGPVLPVSIPKRGAERPNEETEYELSRRSWRGGMNGAAATLCCIGAGEGLRVMGLTPERSTFFSWCTVIMWFLR